MSLTDHYGQGGTLLDRLLDALAAAGRDTASLSIDDLSGADEFHLGGRVATEQILELLELVGTERILDVGCGLGGPARYIATSTGCVVHGVDLTREFVDVATDLSVRTGLSALTSFHCADVTAGGLPVEPADIATILHVGMNVQDKQALFDAMTSALVPGGRLVVYDIMRIGDGEIAWPMPWSAGPHTSFVATPEAYAEMLLGAGFGIVEQRDFRPIVKAALESAATADEPVNLGHLMGDDFPTMFGNLRAALGSGVVAPILMIAERADGVS